METIVRLPGVITISRTTGEITKHYENVDIMAHKDVFLGLMRLGRRWIENGIINIEEEEHPDEKRFSGKPD